MQVRNNSIKDWASDDRPREKLLRKTPVALSDSELLAILLHHGTREKSAVDLARELLCLGKNDLDYLGRLSVKDFMKIKGIGMAKAIAVVAALELGRRRQGSSARALPVVKSSRDVAQFLQSRLGDEIREIFAVLYLNQANRINHFEILSFGGITATIVDIRLILRKALEEEAVNMIICHNHPSGSLKPSSADKAVTEKIKNAALHFDIKLLDHLIVSREGYFSFADEGLL